jgi:AcrR family transcriptional regulator
VKIKDDTKTEQVYAATLKLVEEMGVAGVTMRRVARKAKVATGTLYIYFKDKDELMNAVFKDCHQSSVRMYFKGYDADEPFLTGLKKILTNIIRHRIENFEKAVFLEQCYHSPFITKSTREMSHRLMRPLYQLLERGKREKKIKKLDTFLLLTFMIGSITEIVRYARYNGKPFTAKRVEEIFELCWQGINIRRQH